MFYCRPAESGAVFKVHLTPRASSEGLGGVHGDALKVRVKAPPVDGRANEALLKLLAKSLKVKNKSLDLVSGQTSRTKMVVVEGLTPEEVTSRLGG